MAFYARGVLRQSGGTGSGSTLKPINCRRKNHGAKISFLKAFEPTYFAFKHLYSKRLIKHWFSVRVWQEELRDLETQQIHIAKASKV